MYVDFGIYSLDWSSQASHHFECPCDAQILFWLVSSDANQYACCIIPNLSWDMIFYLAVARNRQKAEDADISAKLWNNHAVLETKKNSKCFNSR